jgi:hypothetical protein
MSKRKRRNKQGHLWITQFFAVSGHGFDHGRRATQEDFCLVFDIGGKVFFNNFFGDESDASFPICGRLVLLL